VLMGRSESPDIVPVKEDNKCEQGNPDNPNHAWKQGD
jgi:hypothetical protein